jgi:hypothetical protein
MCTATGGCSCVEPGGQRSWRTSVSRCNGGASHEGRGSMRPSTGAGRG